MSTSTPSAKARPSRLGKGLSSLMAHPVQIQPEIPAKTLNSTPATTHSAPIDHHHPAPATQPPNADGVVHLPIDAIIANPFQPRQRFEPSALKSLAESIKAQGVMQPVIVRPPGIPAPGNTPGSTPGNNSANKTAKFEIVAGERRWRAAQLAGLTHIPAIVRNLDNRQIAEWALVENLQREDLNPIERAKAFQNLIQQFQLSHEQIASRVGVERSTISNSLRLLGLHHDIQHMVQEGLLSGGQAKVLAGLPDVNLQVSVAQRAVKGDWSVRQVESAVRTLLASRPEQISTPSLSAPAKPRAAHLADLEEQISQQLQTKIHIRPARKKGAGTLAIEFYSLDQFDALLSRLGVQTGE